MHPVIETERLILRPPKLGDEKPLNEAHIDHAQNNSNGCLGRLIQALSLPCALSKKG